MAYIGNTAETQGFTPAVDFFSGNGSTTAFTLSRPVASVAQVQATIENVPQNPGDAFTVSGNTITFTSAPPSGTNNIYVYYTSPITQVIQPGQGTVGTAQLQSGVLNPTAISDQLNASTGDFDLPTGTTAQRPGTPAFGMIRANTTTGLPEWYDAAAAQWKGFSIGVTYNVEYLVVAGAGGGGSCGGGGGAGGYISSSSTLSAGAAYAVTIGAGGAGGTSGVNGVQGSDSSLVGSGISGAIAIGGGRGAGNVQTGGFSGGSGGGAGSAGVPGGGTGGAGTSGQGNAGGNGNSGSANYGAGGGGGAGSAGGNGTNSNGGAGGAGLNWQSLGTFYAAGGGGGIQEGSTGGIGGSSIGGNGTGNSTTGGSGTANRGAGGGGGGYLSTFGNGGAGGSGVVVIRYTGTQKGSGGTVTSAGGYTYHTFTTSGTYTA